MSPVTNPPNLVTATKLGPWSAKYLFRPSPPSLGSGFGNLTQPDPGSCFSPFSPVGWTVSQQVVVRRMQEGDSFSHGSNRNSGIRQTTGTMMLLWRLIANCQSCQSPKACRVFQKNKLTSSPISETKTTKSEMRDETRKIL